MKSNDIVCAMVNGKLQFIATGDLYLMKHGEIPGIVGTAELNGGFLSNFQPLKSSIPKPETVQYEKGVSCLKRGLKHEWTDKGNYFKCMLCGSSKTKAKSVRKTTIIAKLV